MITNAILTCICLFCFLFLNYVSFRSLNLTQTSKKYHGEENKEEIKNNNKISSSPLNTNYTNDFLTNHNNESEPSGGEKTEEENKVTCHFPQLNPFDKDVLKFFGNPAPNRGNCQKEHPLIFKSTLNGTILKVEDPSKYNYKNCCYISFAHRGKFESKIRYTSKCRFLKKEETAVTPPDSEFVQIVCRKDGKIVTVDFFGFTPSSKRSKFIAAHANLNNKKYLYEEDEEAAKKKEPRKVNVVVLGMDSTSHMNFQRTMPLTFGYLTRNLSAVGMSGYTKIGDNSYPNIVAILMGRNESEVRKICHSTRYEPFDDCPLIWKKYQRENYMTAYGEDSIELGNFKYLNKGFRAPPVDFYYNTLMTQMSSVIGHGHYVNTNWCLGPRLGFEVLLDFMKKMAFNMQRSRPYFQFIWACSLFHDDINGGILGDKILLESIQWLQNGGYLNDTVFILASDHGSRWADLRNTPHGKIEDRMPLLYFTFPPWFRQKYKKAMNNLKLNSKRLTTHFDFHETLVDLLHLQSVSEKKIDERELEMSKRKVQSRGISLFLPVPLDRDCEDAEISQHFCVCTQMKEIPVGNNSLVEEAAQNVVSFLNKLFLNFPQCRKLTLQKVDSAQVLESKNGKTLDSVNLEKLKNKEPVTFSISLTVSPSDAKFEGLKFEGLKFEGLKFEATVTRETNGSWIISKEISRTNLYGNQSFCVDDYKMKKYCFCQ